MKKILTTLVLAVSSLMLSTAAFADIAPLPGERVRETMSSWIIPVILIVVIIAVVILVKVLRGRRK